MQKPIGCKMRVCFVVSTPMTVNAFLVNHINLLATEYDIYLVANLEHVSGDLQKIPAELISIPLVRKISIISDLKALFLLIDALTKNDIDLVLSITPKAGFITAVAARIAFTKRRIHWYTGQVWFTKTGFARLCLMWADKLISFLNTQSLVDSHSQLRFLISSGVLNKQKSNVLGSGSICGVDTRRFRYCGGSRAILRNQYGINHSDTVILFLGRLKRDKGAIDLAYAFKDINRKNSHLFYVGLDEDNLEKEIRENLKLDQSIHFVGPTKTPEQWLSAADIFCLPSYREGFGVSVLEAASVGIPVIVSRIYGLNDAVKENETGLMHEVGDVVGIKECISRVIDNPEMAKRLTRNAKQRIDSEFKSEYVTGLFFDYIKKLCSQN